MELSRAGYSVQPALWLLTGCLKFHCCLSALCGKLSKLGCNSFVPGFAGCFLVENSMGQKLVCQFCSVGHSSSMRTDGGV